MKKIPEKINGFRKLCFLIIYLCVTTLFSHICFSQNVFFADGYHGGVYGHYPPHYTQFIVDMLSKNPNWKINIEIEPETWDSVQAKDSDAFNQFKALFQNQSATGARIEYVNPSYAQSYLYNISGESIIRQFQYGIEKVKQYFSSAVFTTYSSEEPCFTSALPQILKSFGFKYAVLKNPNTCWGGYTKAFGGELVNWVSPDGTKIPTVPRYAIESLQSNSTWQTIAWSTSHEYIDAAIKDGIKHPVGMCLQDAGWHYGPWLDTLKGRGAKDAEYVTWRNYFENIALINPSQDWRVSQEDIQVSLVWGSQVLQKVAQEVRRAENRIGMAEEFASVAKLYKNIAYPADTLREAWRTLMLSQHHDCWITPYNGKPGNTWADKVKRWTDYAITKSDSIINQSIAALLPSQNKEGLFITIFNASGIHRNELASVALPNDWNDSQIKVVDRNNKEVLSQVVFDSSNKKQIIFNAEVPSAGYSTYQIKKEKNSEVKGSSITLQQDGTYKLETDFYKIIIDANKGGVIKSLIAKKINNKEFTAASNPRSFNELRGNFYKEGGFHSSTERPVTIKIVENGPLRIRLQVDGRIASYPFTQAITLVQGEPRIDFNLKINWNSNPSIGDNFKPDSTYKALDLRKAFYNDTCKLLALFPMNLKNQEVYKDAPFDVTESKLENTFFTTWDSIKNNIILNWVDVVDSINNYGLALFTDHTTSYVHGNNYSLALNIQFSGTGLWGRNYKIAEPTEINYALIPHQGKWNNAHLFSETTKWNEPLITTVANSSTTSNLEKSVISIENDSWQMTSMAFEGNDLLARFFNAESNSETKKIAFSFHADEAELVELNGEIKQKLKIQKDNLGKNFIQFAIPQFGIRTIRFVNASAQIKSN
ncbi:MAG: glycoside hydrolase family 38 C-terminal domain-containing protein [Parafilimonas sp.]